MFIKVIRLAADQLKIWFTICMNTTGRKTPPPVNLYKDSMPLADDKILLADSDYDPQWSIQDLHITQTYLNKNMKYHFLIGNNN
jgi:hypothetical protein